MSHAVLRTEILLVLAALSPAAGDVEVWRLGGRGGQPWADWVNMEVMVDDSAVPGAIQPVELHPEENFTQRVAPWYLDKFPVDPDYRPGRARIWRGVNYTVSFRGFSLSYIDGDPTTYTVYIDWDWTRLQNEFDTLDFGAPIPLDRFVVYPPEGTEPVTDEPFRPNFILKKFELSGGLDAVKVQREQGDDYHPLEVMLAQVDNNFDAVTEVRFPLQYLRFLRFKAFGEGAGAQESLKRLATAEMEVYGQGFAPQATYDSKAVDLGQEFNIGRVVFGVSRWRREGEKVVPAPDAQASASVEIKIGRDDSPVAFFGYNDQAETVEVSQDEYKTLRPRVYSWDPPAVGWRGPFAEDQKNWSFWSVPLRESGARPGVPSGRYFQLRVKLETQNFWEYAQVESLAVEVFPLLADRVVGEVVVAGEETPAGGVAQVRIGEVGEFVYALRPQFKGKDRAGFDAVRITTPSEPQFRRLEMGEALEAVEPDSVRTGPEGMSVYLPRRVDAELPLRITLRTALYMSSTRLEGEVFNRRESGLVQQIEEGDAAGELGTDRLQILASNSSQDQVLGSMAIRPAVLTPNQDGRNDQVRIAYTLFGVEVAQVEVELYALGGERVRRIYAQQPAGPHEVEWDGRDEKGRLVAPGLYLCRVIARTERGSVSVFRTLPVAY